MHVCSVIMFFFVAMITLCLYYNTRRPMKAALVEQSGFRAGSVDRDI